MSKEKVPADPWEEWKVILGDFFRKNYHDTDSVSAAIVRMNTTELYGWVQKIYPGEYPEQVLVESLQEQSMQLHYVEGMKWEWWLGKN